MNLILLIEMLERMSVFATLAFLLSQTAMFRRLVNRCLVPRDKVWLTVIFGLFGIAGTYAGIPVDDALANSRVVGVMAAGLVGGPLMGVAAGLIAGGHRFLLGGFTAFSCGLANICEGLLAGAMYRIFPRRPMPWWLALAGGVVGETMQMGIILLTARPYPAALALVREIALPMIVVNSLGLAVFMLIIKTAGDVHKRVGAEESQKALHIATKTLPFLRRGLTEESARATAQIIYNTTNYDAVAVTDTARILAYVGAEARHHAGGSGELTTATKRVLHTGEMYIANTPREIGCLHHRCGLASAVVVPLKRAGNIIGTLKLYYTRSNAVGPADSVFGAGLAHLFSTQLELAEIDRQAKLAARAELKALHAQINPHFFFNTLNTITSLVRTKPDLARELLLKLGAIFRYTLDNTGQNITIAEELAQVRAYLTIEQARQGDKLLVYEDVAPELEKYRIPSLTIQPLVENAVKHGLQPKEDGGQVRICVTDAGRDIAIQVRDNGVGMDLDQRHPLAAGREGIGLANVHERLRGLYGGEYGLILESQPGVGTTVTLRVPKKLEEDDNCA